MHLLALGLLVVVPASAANLRDRLKPCDFKGVPADTLCGSLEIPENRADPQGRKLTIHVAALPALDRIPEPDPLFPLSGGPGQSAIDGAASDARRFAALRTKRDIILVDQRGTGRSNRLQCEMPGAAAALRMFVGGDIDDAFSRDCAKRLAEQADLRYYDTTTFVRDLDAVREWLGYDTVNLYGGSYGARPALVYLREFPKRVRTVTIRSPATQATRDPLYGARDAQSSLDLTMTACAADPKCSATFPRLREELNEAVTKLAAKPPMVGEVELTRDVFAGSLRRALSDASTAAWVPLLIHEVNSGDYQYLDGLARQVGGLTNAIALGLNITLHCAEDVPFIRPDQIAAATKDTVMGDRMIRGLRSACAHWPRSSIPASFLDPIRSATPVLIFTGEIDPQQPPVWGREAAKTLPNSKHVTFTGIAHNPFPDCGIEMMTRFVMSGVTRDLPNLCEGKTSRPPFVLARPAKP